ncbi:hypothetical protein DFH08DRAFT_888689 [Mycena albidolilacea]|uniref:Protein kinase domain-containing protein n=1 Tax=Mycena albidolilacea TaxID=1033008 RepID=A0AAD6ZGD3_9AGAR|nr:hypothetical protein DFH08DRAFT_888689 [Mycena albidolilacea]
MKSSDDYAMNTNFEAYQRLASHGVTGVPEVYGIFEDLEGGPIALIISYCDITLWELNSDNGSVDFLTPAQTDRFIAILKSIHEAGVRHCDIRVENLMLAEGGDPVIVDFDRARFNPIPVKKWEMDILRAALRGEYHDFSMHSPGPYDGPTPSAQSEESNGNNVSSVDDSSGEDGGKDGATG